MHHRRFFSHTPFLNILAGYLPGLWLAWMAVHSSFGGNLVCRHEYFVAGCGLLVVLFLYCRKFRRGWWLFYFLVAFMLMGLQYSHLMQTEAPAGRVRFVFAPDERPRIYEDWGTVTGTASIRAGAERVRDFRCALSLRNPLAVKELFNDGRPLVCEGEFKEVENSPIPGTFDRKAYYFVKGIRHQVWLEPADIAGYAAGNGWGWALRLRHWASRAIAAGGLPAKTAGFADAFFTGQKSALDRDVQRDFSLTGISHILAVSGQHVGLIYLLLTEVLLAWMTGRRMQRWRSIVVVVLIWAYIAMTGMSASAIRAGYMFTLFSIGGYIPFRVNSLNILCFSAFSMLIVNPFLLFDVGFQLSYAAMAGIIVVFPLLRIRITRLPMLATRLLDMVMLTLAAQVFTFPLVVYYFKMFPLLFIFSNLLTGFLLPAVMALIFLYLLSSPVGAVQWIVAKVLGWLIDYILGVASFLADIPFGVMYFMDISVAEAAILLIFGVFITVFLIQKKAWMLQVALGAICLLLVVSSAKAWGNKQKEYLAFFHWRGSNYIAWSSGTQGYVCYMGGKKTEDHAGMPPIEAYFASRQRMLTAWFDRPCHITVGTGAWVEEAGPNICVVHLPFANILMADQTPDSTTLSIALHPAVDIVTCSWPADLKVPPSSALWINIGRNRGDTMYPNQINLRDIGWKELVFKQ